jgi:hypothetical protein
MTDTVTQPDDFGEDKIAVAQAKYNKSEKGKAAQKRYHSSGKAKAKRTSDEQARIRQQKYLSTPKGRETQKTRLDQQKLFRKAAKWLEENPGKTLDDYQKVYDEEERNRDDR